MAIQAPTFSGDTAGAKASGKIEAVIGDSRISRNLKGNMLCSCVTPAYMYGLSARKSAIDCDGRTCLKRHLERVGEERSIRAQHRGYWRMLIENKMREKRGKTRRR